MQINLEKEGLRKDPGGLLVVFQFAGKGIDIKRIPGAEGEIAESLLKKIELLSFAGKAGQDVVFPLLKKTGFDEVVLVGLGEKRGDLSPALREATGHAFHIARRAGHKKITVRIPGKDLAKDEYVEAITVAAHLANYAFDAYKKSNGEKRAEELTIEVPEGASLTKLRTAALKAEIVADGVTVARDLVNTPAEIITPSRLALLAEELVKASGDTLALTILDKADCEKLGMGAYLAVGKGSDEPLKFIHLAYTSPRKTKKTVAVIGKGVTFDSGGLSLKPADAMMTMKCDMAGAAAVLGLFATLNRLKPRVNVHGIIPAVENMPSGKAIRPGDIVKAMSGKTVEILNTDAEGRLTLADAMTYTREKIAPDVMIDLATLTGACMVALGEEIAGVMTNDRALAGKILKSAKTAGEKMWELPLEERYKTLTHSDIADLRNIPTTRYGGALMGGLFLEEFAEGKPWAHLDIAGPAFAERPIASYLGKGGTGYGVRTLVEYLQSIE